MSAAHKGKKLSAEHRAKISEVQKGRIFSDETRAKISAARKKQVISKGMKGKKHSAESRQKMREAKLGKKQPNISKAMYARYGGKSKRALLIDIPKQWETLAASLSDSEHTDIYVVADKRNEKLVYIGHATKQSV